MEKHRRALARLDNTQPGDVAKGAERIVDVLTKSGTAERRIFR